MKQTVLAKRYAKALFELSIEKGLLSEVEKELTQMAALWRDHAEFRTVFDNPKVETEQRIQFLKKLASHSGMSTLVLHTLCLLADRHRLTLLPNIAEAFQRKAEEAAGKVRAQVVTASSLPPEYINTLQQTLSLVTGKHVVVEHEQDPSLIAGIVTRVGDTVYDGSARNRLQELEDELLRSSV